MTRTLQKHGNSYALVFDKSMMDALNISPDMPLQVVISGGSVVVTPVHVGIPKQELSSAIKTLRPRYKAMLENLAK